MKLSASSDPAGEIRRQERISAAAQPLMNELLVRSGIRPGMRVLNVGALLGDAAFLVAERIGAGGSVLALESDERFVKLAQDRAFVQGFRNVTFRCAGIEELELDAPVDAVVGRFYLRGCPHPAETIRRAASYLRDGGHVIFQEWDYRSMYWSIEHLPHHLRFAATTVEALAQRGVHVRMGTQLVDAFVNAGLPVPSIRTEAQPVAGSGDYALLHDIVCDEGLEGSAGADLRLLQSESAEARVHTYFPLQVGAWTRVTR